MLLTEIEARERLESPDNLVNRLKAIIRPSNHYLSRSDATQHPSIPPKSEDIIDDLTEKIASSSLKSKAANIMTAAMDELKARLPEVQKPETLARIASEMGKVIESQTNKNPNEDRRPQFLIYAPEINNESNYQTINVGE